MQITEKLLSCVFNEVEIRSNSIKGYSQGGTNLGKLDESKNPFFKRNNIQMCMRACVHMDARFHACMHASMHACMYACIHACMCICACGVCSCFCASVCTRMCVRACGVWCVFKIITTT